MNLVCEYATGIVTFKSSYAQISSNSKEDMSVDELEQVEVLRESPGAWGGRTLVLFQDAMPRASRLMAPGADLGNEGDVGQQLTWRLVTFDGDQLTARQIRLIEAVELLPEDWRNWPRNTHEEVMQELEELIGSENPDLDAEYLKRLQGDLEHLRRELREFREVVRDE